MTSTRDHLVGTAGDLFYARGITATGVDAVVRAVGVTKPTLYAYFPSKASLVAAVLEQRHDDRRRELEDWLADVAVRDRPLAVFDWLSAFYTDRGERGCGFLNAAAELPDDSPALAAVRVEKAWFLDLLVRLCAEAGHPGSEQLGSQLLLLVDGVAGRVVVGGPEGAGVATADARAAAVSLLAAHR